MEVTTKRPSGLTVTPRCEPFHSSFSGAPWRVGEPQRRAVVMRDRKPKAFRHERQARRRSRAPRALRRSSLPLRTKAVLPADQATAPSGPTPRGRSSGAWHRSRARCVRAGVGRHHLAVVAAGDDARAVRAERGCRRRGRACGAVAFRRRAAAPPRPARKPRCCRGNARRPPRAPAATGRVRSTTEGFGAGCRSCHRCHRRLDRASRTRQSGRGHRYNCNARRRIPDAPLSRA